MSLKCGDNYWRKTPVDRMLRCQHLNVSKPLTVLKIEKKCFQIGIKLVRSKTLNEHLTFTVVERADFSFLLGHSGGGKSSRCFDPLTALSNYIIFSRIETSFFKRKSPEELICFVCIGPKRPLLVVCCDKTSKNRHWEDSAIAECIPPIINLNRYYAFRGKQPILCLSPRAGIFERPSRRDRFERKCTWTPSPPHSSWKYS